MMLSHHADVIFTENYVDYSACSFLFEMLGGQVELIKYGTRWSKQAHDL